MGQRRKRSKPLPPRRKRMKRPQRLQSAPTWLRSYTGKNVVRGYSRWFGVDLGCAVKELRLLGVEISVERAAQIRASVTGRRRRKRQLVPLGEPWTQARDDDFAYVAGFTPNGLPYGITEEDGENLDILGT